MNILVFRLSIIIAILSLSGCTQNQIVNECDINFFEIANRNEYVFEGKISLCHYPNPNDLVLQIQDASVKFISYENKDLMFQLTTKSDFFENDTILIYKTFCFEGGDDLNSKDDQLFIWIFNDIDTVGYFVRSQLQFQFSFDYQKFNNCYEFGMDAHFNGILKE